MLQIRRALGLAPIHLLPMLVAILSAQPAGAQDFDMIDSGQSLGNAHSRDVALADLDGDGDLDAFVANNQFIGPPPNRVWINQGGAQAGGAGTFLDSGQALGDGQSEAVALGDLDGDGDVDAFVGNLFNGTDAANRIWLNDGAGTFQAGAQALGTNNTFDIALGDVDGDGDLDAVAANPDSGTPNTLWINQGGAQGGTEGVFSAAGMLGTAQAGSVALGDLDGDGDLDAVLGVSLGTPRANQIWINQGGAQSGTPGVFSNSGQILGNQRTFAIRLGDIDGDSDLDIYSANSGTTMEDVLWINPGADANGDPGAFLPAAWTGPSLPSTDAVLADFDGDGGIDVFVTRSNQLNRANEVWLNDGAGGFVDSGLSLGSNPSTAVAAGDVDGDGDIDAWVANDGTSDGPAPNRLWLRSTGSGPGPDTADLSISTTPTGTVHQRIPDNGSDLSAFIDIDVVNAGPDAAGDLVMEVFAIEPGVILTSPGMTCAQEVDRERCELASLDAGQSAPATMSLFALRQHNNGIFAGSLWMSARVFSAAGDPDTNNNSDGVQYDFYDCLTACFIESIFCRQNFGGIGRGDSTDPSTHRGATAGFVPDLPIYYLLRQTMNYGSPGQRLVQRYADHQAEILSLAENDSALMSEALSVLESWQPLLAALVTGDPESEVVTQARVDALDAFLANLEAAGSPALAQAITEERAEIGPLDNLVGLTAGQAADLLIPSDVLFKGGFERPELLNE